MPHPKISLIAAISKNRVLGRNNDLIWRIPEDLKRFRQLTEHHAIIMGRKTYQSIGRPLPNRTNIVISRDPGFDAPGCIVVHTFNAGIAEAAKTEIPSTFAKATSELKEKIAEPEIFVIGGGQIFREAIKVADKLYLTIIDRETSGDAHFPAYADFKTVNKSEAKTFQGLSFWHEDLERIYPR